MITQKEKIKFMTTTSLEAWDRISNSTRLSELRKTVARLVAQNPNSTANEIVHRSGGLQQNSINPRFKELEKMNVIVRQRSRRCSITGYLCDTYSINPTITEEGIVDIKQLPAVIKPAPILKRLESEEEMRFALDNDEMFLVPMNDMFYHVNPNSLRKTLNEDGWKKTNTYKICRFTLEK